MNDSPILASISVISNGHKVNHIDHYNLNNNIYFLLISSETFWRGVKFKSFVFLEKIKNYSNK